MYSVPVIMQTCSYFTFTGGAAHTPNGDKVLYDEN